MKGTIVLVLMVTAISMVYAGSLFDAKEDATNKVKNKHEEAKNLKNKIKSDIENEKAKKQENSLNQALNTLKKKTEESNEELNKNVMEVTKTAIAKGKPLQVINCIANTLNDGKQIILDSNNNLKTAIDNVYNNKLKKLQFLEFELDLISRGLDDLMNEVLKKIKEVKSGYEGLVADAFKKVDAAQKQFHDIENTVDKPSLINEYSNFKIITENKYKEISDTLLKRLQKCLA